MGARQRLNRLYLIGALVLAAAAGALLKSWGVFVVVFGLLIISLVAGGDIRLEPSRSRRTRPRRRSRRSRRR